MNAFSIPAASLLSRRILMVSIISFFITCNAGLSQTPNSSNGGGQKNTNTEVEKDIQRATELTLAIKRNKVRSNSRALSIEESLQVNSALEQELNRIRARYRPGAILAAFSSEFSERVKTAVQNGTDEAKWLKEAKLEYAAKMGGPPPDLGFLSQMPDTNRVYADIKGSDEPDTRARQRGAFVQLMNIIGVLTDNQFGFKPRSPEEIQLLATYRTARDQIVWPKFDEAETKQLGMQSPHAKWVHLMYRYETDAELEKELWSRYFSPEWQARLASLKAEAQEQRRQSEAREQAQEEGAKRIRREQFMNQYGQYVIGLIVVVYLLLCYFAAKFAFAGKMEILDTAAIPTLRSNGIEYGIHMATGTVIEQTKETVTHTRVSGGYNDRPVTSSTWAVAHREFFLKTDRGEESFQLAGVLAEIAMREGHNVSVLWAIRKGEKTGNCFFLKNHTTGYASYNDSVLKQMVWAFSDRHIPLILLSIMGCLFGLMIYLFAKILFGGSGVGKLRALTDHKVVPMLEIPAKRE